MSEKKKITNQEYSKTEKFQLLCSNAGTEATRRQASKFRNQKGLVYRAERFRKGVV